MTDTNRPMLEAVIVEMGELREQVVFIGGAIVGLLIGSSAGDPVRETDDVDCIVEVGASIITYQQIERQLRAQRWKSGSELEPTDPLCRFRKGPLTLDVMPTDSDILGFSAGWAKEAIEKAQFCDVGGAHIRLVTAPYFLALKIDAFRSRGRGDYYGSHDLEDLTAVVEGRPSIADEVREEATIELQTFLAESLGEMWVRLVSESVPGAVRGDPTRSAVVEQRLMAIRDFRSASA